MSNQIVPHIYRMIIDDVMANIGVDFEEYGMDEQVLTSLLSKWEEKLLETRVADFARAPNDEDDGSSDNGDFEANRPPTENRQANSEPYGHAGGSNSAQYYASSQYDANRQFAGGLALPTGRVDDVRVKAEPEDVIRPRGGAADDGGIASDVKPEPNAAGLLPGDEVIDSDLDDSEGELDDDVDGGDDANTDYVFCVYDKVQRVKNKWKTVFKDGMMHINGRDYLFQKCNGEFEW